MSNKNKDSIVIKKQAMIGIAPAVAIIGVLLSKGDIGPLILFLVGISAGMIIQRGMQS